MEPPQREYGQGRSDLSLRSQQAQLVPEPDQVSELSVPGRHTSSPHALLFPIPFALADRWRSSNQLPHAYDPQCPVSPPSQLWIPQAVRE